MFGKTAHENLKSIKARIYIESNYILREKREKFGAKDKVESNLLLK